MNQNQTGSPLVTSALPIPVGPCDVEGTRSSYYHGKVFQFSIRGREVLFGFPNTWVFVNCTVKRFWGIVPYTKIEVIRPKLPESLLNMHAYQSQNEYYIVKYWFTTKTEHNQIVEKLWDHLVGDQFINKL